MFSQPSGTEAISGQTIDSSDFNTLIDDLVADANLARPITAGGTGAANAADARVNLNVSAIDATVVAFAALTFSADTMLYATGADSFAVGTLTSFARTILDDADAATARTTLGLGNVDNTSDATKNAASVTLTNKTLTSPTINGAALSGTITGTPNFTGPPTISGSAIWTTGNVGAAGATLIGYTPVPTTRTVSAGNGLSGGGALSVDRTLAIDTSITADLSTAQNFTNKSIRVPTSSETGSTLTSASANKMVALASDPTINASVFTAGDIVLFYAGASSRTITQGTITQRLHGSSTTGNLTLAARGLASAYFVSASECVISGDVS